MSELPAAPTKTLFLTVTAHQHDRYGSVIGHISVALQPERSCTWDLIAMLGMWLQERAPLLTENAWFDGRTDQITIGAR